MPKQIYQEEIARIEGNLPWNPYSKRGAFSQTEIKDDLSQDHQLLGNKNPSFSNHETKQNENPRRWNPRKDFLPSRWKSWRGAESWAPHLDQNRK